MPSRVLSADAVEAVAWRNGAGSTRQLVDDPGGWRLSVADLEVDAAFSDFTGLDRVFLPLVDVVLSIDGEHRAVARGTAVEFRGEAEVAVELVAGPGRAVNLMTVRGRCSGGLTAMARSEWEKQTAQSERTVRSEWDESQSGVFVDLGEVVVEVWISYST